MHHHSVQHLRRRFCIWIWLNMGSAKAIHANIYSCIVRFQLGIWFLNEVRTSVASRSAAVSEQGKQCVNSRKLSGAGRLVGFQLLHDLVQRPALDLQPPPVRLGSCALSNRQRCQATSDAYSLR